MVPCLDDTEPFIADSLAVHRNSSTQRLPMKLHARYVSVSDFDDQYFEASFGNELPAVDHDPDEPMRPYVLLQRQFEDEDGGVCNLETHDPDCYVGTSGSGLSNSLPPASPSRSTGPNTDWWKSPSDSVHDASGANYGDCGQRQTHSRVTCCREAG